jgi:response regulator RpfG family c-di-GMP phosphodiesterase
MNSDVWLILVGLAAVTLALGYYTRVELPLLEDERMRQSMRAFAKAIELRFPSHAGLSSRVAALSNHVGEEMGLDVWKLHELEMAAWLRDIGLCAISYQLVNKKPNYAWTDADKATYARHPEVSAAMLELAPALRRLAPIVRCHHANFDGSSGPYFPHGRDLPIESRILKVISDYVWFERRQGQVLAREHLRDGAGKAYDPDVVGAFVGVLSSPLAVVEAIEPVAKEALR